MSSINWDEWEQNLHTSGVVSKIKQKYELFMKAEYSVESAASQVGNQTDKMQHLDIANTYNFMLYLTHFVGHLEQLETMRNIGDVTEMSNLEWLHLSPGLDTLGSINAEMGNLAPEDYIEDGVYTRITT